MCFTSKRSKTLSSPKNPSRPREKTQEINLEDQNVKHQVILRIPGCKVHLMEQGEAFQLAEGEFELVRVSDENVSLATTVKVGDEQLQWPLTKDEPVVKLGSIHYIFSLPMTDGNPLSYGVTFSEKNAGNLDMLDSFLKENSLFTCSSSRRKMNYMDWKEFAPVVDDYNNVLAKAIAGGTGHIVKGIFICSNAYINQVQKGSETILNRATEEKGQLLAPNINNKISSNTPMKNKNAINQSLKRVRKLSEMTEKMSKAMLDVVGTGSSWVIRTEAGKKFLAMVPGQVLLASFDAVNKIIDAAEAAERQAMTATSGAVTRMVTQRFGEGAGEVTEDALATAGHCVGTAWNVIKIRKAINPKFPKY